MATPKPRKAWTNVRKAPKIDPSVIEDICGSIEIVLAPDLRADLLAAIERYLAGKDLLDDRPTIPEQRAALEKLSKDAKMLADDIKNLDDVSRGRLTQFQDILDQTLLSATLVKGIVKKTLSQDPYVTRIKPCASNALYGLVGGLMGIYERATGLKAGRGYYVTHEPGDSSDYELGGLFVRFTQSVLSVIDPTLELHATSIHNVIRTIQTR
jgi:hypothetical protein